MVTNQLGPVLFVQHGALYIICGSACGTSVPARWTASSAAYRCH